MFKAYSKCSSISATQSILRKASYAEHLSLRWNSSLRDEGAYPLRSFNKVRQRGELN